MIIYLVKNKINGKGYVGKTIRGLEKRWSEHVKNALENKDEMILYSAIRKYGPCEFELTILQECYDEDELNIAEKSWIFELKTFGEGYNMTAGGDGIRGYKHTEETKKKMSEDRLGEKNCNWGKKFSRETCLKISQNKIGTGTGPRPHMIGRKRSYETTLKIIKALSKKVDQLDLNGNVIASYDSMKEAEQITGIKGSGIFRCCRYPHHSAYGYKFRFAEEQTKE